MAENIEITPDVALAQIEQWLAILADLTSPYDAAETMRDLAAEIEAQQPRPN